VEEEILTLLEQSNGFDRYSSAEGHFYIKDPLEVLAMIPGETDILGKQPCVYMVYREVEKYRWYIEALKIVVETIDHVLAQPDPENYVFHWSG
jgi:hypothetical protein